MDADVRCRRCAEGQAVVAAFVGPVGMVDVSHCPECGQTKCGPGISDLLRLGPFRRRRSASPDQPTSANS
jgi:hypothetical protein